MNSTFLPISLLQQTLTLILLFLPSFINPSSSSSSSSLDHHNILVYKHCDHSFKDLRNPKYPADDHDDHHHSKTLSSFFDELESMASQSKFFKTLVGSEESAVSGSFQCRKDISTVLCLACVKNLRQLLNISCEDATSARVQLEHCYLNYRVENIDTNRAGNSENYKLLETPEHGLIHKECGGGTAEPFAGFEEMRDAALATAATGVVDGDGFYAANYELLHVVAQCDGEVRVCDCGNCVAAATATATEECRWSASGRFYLDGCYVGYTYYPHGFSGNSYHEDSNSGNTGKALAIVLGIASALVFGVIFLIFLKNLRKKNDDW